MSKLGWIDQVKEFKMTRKKKMHKRSPALGDLQCVEEIIGLFAEAHLDNAKQMRREKFRSEKRCNKREEALKDKALKKTSAFEGKRKKRRRPVQVQDCDVRPDSSEASVLTEESPLSEILDGTTGREAFYVIADILCVWYGMSKQTVVPKSLGVLFVAVQQYFGIPMTKFFGDAMFGESGPFSGLREMPLSSFRDVLETIKNDWTLAKTNAAFGNIWRFIVAVGAVVYGSLNGTDVSRGYVLDVVATDRKSVV